MIKVVALIAGIAMMSVSLGCDSRPQTPTSNTATSSKGASAKPVNTKKGAVAWEYPQPRELNSQPAIVHAPQIQAWPEFKTLDALVAIEYFEQGQDKPATMLNARVGGDTEIDLDNRLVTIKNAAITSVYRNGKKAPDMVDDVQTLIRSKSLAMPLDIFLTALSDTVLDDEGEKGFNTAPPIIKVMVQDTIALIVPGKPYLKAIDGTDWQVAQNANWPLLKLKDSWYLLVNKQWLTASNLASEWRKAAQLPQEISQLAGNKTHSIIAESIPAKQNSSDVPIVLYHSSPIELIVTAGTPTLEKITGDLSYLSNTESPLFKLENTWYFLSAGRWFKTNDLNNGPWLFVNPLPDEFTNIPADHKMSFVRASIKGTVEARLAILELMLPRTKTVERDNQPDIKVLYDGEPTFETIPGTSVKRATNSPQDVFIVNGNYYLVYEAVWYLGAGPDGPWKVTDNVPDAIYDIPADSPSYSATDVKVAESSGNQVTYVHTAGYDSNTYVYYGVPVYSTGYYYWPYYGAYYWYYYPAYGYGRYYNPNTGAYGWRSSWYGPYGGYSYGEGYNPKTGRMGYRETWWDGDEWASYGEMYNPRTGIETRTSRYYDEDSERYEFEREIEGKRNEIDVERTVDIDDQWSESKRENSRGGSVEMQREWDDDGNLKSSGTIESADGRTATVTGNYKDGEGTTTINGSDGGGGTITREKNGDTVTRSGEFTNKDGKTYESTSTRDGRDSVYHGESSTGGEIKSISKDGERKTIGKNDQGDVFAGHNGEVYKKTDDGWQKYDPDSGNWQQSESTRSSRNNGTATTTQQRSTDATKRAQNSTSRTTNNATTNANRTTTQQLNRDARSRTQGSQRFQQRRANSGARAGGLLRRRR
ncbi:hypothetical protein ACFSJY_08700 [Thalassotalea euphylliae]|uniref:hypothetical protein n=1 Tax=Thalassotalea euphylliae TaxID=1655234 RepID=UPI003627549F